MTLLEGKTAVATGGARGIGEAIVRRFAAAGATGVVFDAVVDGVKPPSGWDLAEVDVRDDEAVASAFAHLPVADIVVAAAGIVPPWRPVAALDLDEWDEVFRVNVRGVASTIRHAAPLLGSGGAIVVIGSLNSYRGDPNLTSYAASKHAVLGIVRSAALDLGPRGVRVNGIAPGPVATDAMIGRMQRRERELGTSVEDALAAASAQTALQRLATVDDVAAAALFLASDLAAAITGHLLPVDGGLL
jgi:NAD(P)-dependent dehydrogenase (short-subunit alcohol dehydrogenase family)